MAHGNADTFLEFNRMTLSVNRILKRKNNNHVFLQKAEAVFFVLLMVWEALMIVVKYDDE